jgi:hypothetical protein
LSLERPYNFGHAWSWNSFLTICRSALSRPFSIILATFLAVLLFVLMFRSISLTTMPPMPGEEKAGLFYAATHLPFFAYVILFIVVCLSIVNLIFQSRIARNWNWRIPFLGMSEPKGTKVRFTGPSRRSSDYNGGQTATSLVKPSQPLDDGIVALRSLGKGNNEKGVFPPTPLDGTNHPLPKFGSSDQNHFTKDVEGDTEHNNSTTSKEFRFCSSVDRPSLEEVERREKERLVVKGFVKTADGIPVGSAVVYLSDPEGNKIGQSCRSNPEDGAFKVIAYESGAYSLHAYKRGYATFDLPHPVPLESGRVEGLEVTLLTEGCLVHGRAILEPDVTSAKDLVIKCFCRSGNFTGTSPIDDDGNFRLTNVPMNSECYLEAVHHDGTVLVRTEAFQTVQKKKLHKDIEIPPSLTVVLDESSEVLNPFIESKSDDLRDDPSLGASSS